MSSVTSRDVANHVGVSQSTVSLVLNDSKKSSISEETRNKVLQAVHELGYIHKPSGKKPVKGGLKNVIAVVVPNLYTYYVQLVDAIEKQAVSRGYGVLLCNIDSRENEEYYTKLFVSQSVSGVIFTFSPNTSNILNAVESKMPAVLLGEKDDSINLDTISLNSMAAGNILVSHLNDQGHKNICFISPSSDIISRATRRRLEGVLSGLDQFGLRGGFVCLFDENYRDNYTFDEYVKSGYKLVKRMRDEYPQITAVIAPDDISCVGIMNRLSDLNLKVPEDIAVCSFDNSVVSRILKPNLTSVEHSTNIRVRIAVDLLIDRINDPNCGGLPYKSESEPILIARQSSLKI